MSPKKSPQAPDAKIVSGVVESTKSKAEVYARDPEKAKKLIDQAVQKAKRQEKNKGPLSDIWNYLTALFRLLRAYVRRQYTDVSWRSIVLITVAILYFVLPTDLIPDFIPVFGFLDDAAVIGFVIAQVKADLDNFLIWEAEQAEPEGKVAE